MVEFAAFITNPGAEGQHFHMDSGNSFSKHQAPLYSLFLFLTDLENEDQGPLQIAPCTHALSTFREAMRKTVKKTMRMRDVGIEKHCFNHWKLLPVRAGDAALYDATLLHRGTANNSTRTRVVVYLSVLGVGELAFGQTYAIDEKLLSPPLRFRTLVNASISQSSLSKELEL